jgi:hypothetical protein
MSTYFDAQLWIDQMIQFGWDILIMFVGFVLLYLIISLIAGAVYEVSAQMIRRSRPANGRQPLSHVGARAEMTKPRSAI